MTVNMVRDVKSHILLVLFVKSSKPYAINPNPAIKSMFATMIDIKSGRIDLKLIKTIPKLYRIEAIVH